MASMNERTRSVVRAVLVASSWSCLAAAGLAGVWFGRQTMDLALLQLVCYGAWACLAGAYLGGTLGASLEEDACGELDMGTMSSMGGILGTLSAGLLGTAFTGLVFFLPWQAVLAIAVTIEVIHLGIRRLWPWSLHRGPRLDERGCLCDEAGCRLPEEQQPLRMRDRVVILLAVSAGLMVALTLAMARMMGSDLGHPVMMAPMMYGMFGTQLGGMLGGWLAGLLDEHRGAAEHDNPVMVGAMALMAGMMGGMPSGMIGGMMAIMGANALALSVAAGLLIPLLLWAVAIRGRYVWRRGSPADRPRAPSPAIEVIGGGSIRVVGMSCAACIAKVERGVGSVPGVASVEVDLPSGTVHLRWGAGFAGMDPVRAAVEDVGYEVG